ncbi:MAG: ATP-binding protein [Lawsonibacter sp.]|jgi:two-component system sensor histidine kinase VicK
MRSLHMKLVMIMVLLILSLMTVVGAFLINSVTAFYLDDFYSQMADAFADPDMIRDLTTQTEEEQAGGVDGADMISAVLEAYVGELGVDGRNRKLYVLDSSGACLVRPEGETAPLEYTNNLTFALTTGIETGEAGDESNLAVDYMDVAVPIQRGEKDYVIYILDNKATANELTDQMFIFIAQSLLFGLIISILLSFLMSKTMVTPIQRLTEGAMRVAEGDFSRKIEVSSRDEIGVLTDTFNDMAGQLQDTLRQVENERNKLDTLFLHMTDGVVAFSCQGKMIHSNPSAAQMLHRKIGIQTTYEQLFGSIAPLEEVLETSDYLEGEMKVQETYLQLLMAPFDQGREDGGALVVLHDVTEQRKNQEMQREFVANVSHELRTPLTNIRSYAETLTERAGEIPQEMEKRFLGVILNESDRMTHIVQDLLTLSRFDSGRDDLRLTRFSFAQTVQDLYNAVYMEAQRHNHTLNLVVEEEMPDIVADRERILQVMMNIVSNSIKYTPDGGHIEISAGKTENRVWMEVDDDGIGIPVEDRPRIFERFYRVDKARSRQSGGTGLGLSIAKEIVDRHQGELFLLDKTGPGLLVRLELKIEGPEHG